MIISLKNVANLLKLNKIYVLILYMELKQGKKRGAKPKEDKKQAVTFMLRQSTINAIGGMEAVRAKAVNHFEIL